MKPYSLPAPVLCLCLAAAAASCQAGAPAGGAAVRNEALSVMPTGANGNGSLSQDGTYLIQDAANFRLSILNAAAEHENRRVVGKKDPSAVKDARGIGDAQLVVIADDPSKLTTLTINGNPIAPTAFIQGAPTLLDGAPMTSGQRLPGHYATVSLGSLRAGQALSADVSVAGKAGLLLHFAAFGDARNGRVLLTAPDSGTTYRISDPQEGAASSVSVTRAGTAQGMVVSDPIGIDCGPQCAAVFPAGTQVILAAIPAPGAAFDGWGGACSGKQGTCAVTSSEARAVTATFKPIPYSVAVTLAGSGRGKVVSSPAAIDCGRGADSCVARLDPASAVTLIATADEGSGFTGWGGACASSSTDTCTLTLADARSVTAGFELNSYPLAVAKEGEADGRITSQPAGINCGGGCAAQYPQGTAVTLTATPGPGAVFAGWTGGPGCATLSPTCTVTVTQATAVKASFSAGLRTPTSASSGSVR